jgi:hypothetical protein
VDLFHRQGNPRAIVPQWPALGVGRGARNLAYLFPQIVVGTSTRVDDYSLEDYLRYQIVVFSGFTWNNRETAETLVRQAAERGVHVVVDLTGIPEDPYARITRFLDVWGESVILGKEPVRIWSDRESQQLQPFGDEKTLWYTNMLQGYQQEVWWFDYVGERAGLIGYNQYGSGQVWFVGLNLPYHAVSTHDQAAMNLLANVLRLTPETPNRYASLPLINYRASQDGYRFEYDLESEGELFVPIAFFDGTRVEIDGESTKVRSLEYLVVFEAPAGRHSVVIRVESTPIYRFGWITSASSVVGIVGLFLIRGRYEPKFSIDQIRAWRNAQPPAGPVEIRDNVE